MRVMIVSTIIRSLWELDKLINMKYLEQRLAHSKYMLSFGKTMLLKKL